MRRLNGPSLFRELLCVLSAAALGLAITAAPPLATAFAQTAAQAPRDPSQQQPPRRRASTTGLQGQYLQGANSKVNGCIHAVTTGDSSDIALQTCIDALDTQQISSTDLAGVYANLGVMYLRRGAHEFALAEIEYALELDPDNPELFANRGAAQLALRQYGPAIASMTNALSLGTEAPYKAYYNRGAAREALGDLHGALEDYSTALEIHPNWAPAEAEIARFVRNRHETLSARLADEEEYPIP